MTDGLSIPKFYSLIKESEASIMRIVSRTLTGKCIMQIGHNIIGIILTIYISRKQYGMNFLLIKTIIGLCILNLVDTSLAIFIRGVLLKQLPSLGIIERLIIVDIN